MIDWVGTDGTERSVGIVSRNAAVVGALPPHGPPPSVVAVQVRHHPSAFVSCNDNHSSTFPGVAKSVDTASDLLAQAECSSS